jgi:hypothetical protein
MEAISPKGLIAFNYTIIFSICAEMRIILTCIVIPLQLPFCIIVFFYGEQESTSKIQFDKPLFLCYNKLWQRQKFMIKMILSILLFIAVLHHCIFL